MTPRKESDWRSKLRAVMAETTLHKEENWATRDADDIENCFVSLLAEIVESMGTRNYMVRVGENALAMKETGLSLAEIKLHNAEAKGWNEGFSAAKDADIAIIRKRMV